MAYEIKKREKLTFDIEPVLDHSTRAAEARERSFIDNDRATSESIMMLYENNIDKIISGSDDQQVMLISSFHAQREFMGWIIGEALLKIKDKIESGDKKGYKSLTDWVNRNEDRLGFGNSAASNYKIIRESSSLDQFKKLGVKKTLVVSQIKDEKKREKVIQVIVEKKMTESMAKEYVEELQIKDRDKVRRAVEEKKTAVKQAVILHVDANRSAVTLKTSKEYADLLIDLFSNPVEIERIKQKLYDMKD